MSVAIASFQREASLERLLGSLADALRQPFAAGEARVAEVIVVLDGSTDGSRDLVERRQEGFPVPLRHLWQPNRGLAAARNAGIDAANGDLVWLLDDDMTVDRSAVERHLAHRRHDSPVLMGACTVVTDVPDIARAMWWYEERHRRLATEGVVTAAKDCSFANTSAPTELLRAHRFDERFRGYGIEDYELALRLMEEGVRIAFALDAAVAHAFSPTRSEMLRKLREEGANRVLFRSLHPTHADIVFRPEPRRLERMLRTLAPVPGAGAAMWLLARLVDQCASVTRRPTRRDRLHELADEFAIHAGVAG